MSIPAGEEDRVAIEPFEEAIAQGETLCALDEDCTAAIERPVTATRHAY